MNTLADQFNDKIHFQEWKDYQAKISKKHQGKPIQPDRLYQQHKQKNMLVQKVWKAKSYCKENLDQSEQIPDNDQILVEKALEPIPEKKRKSKDFKTSTSTRSSGSTGALFFKSNKKAEYYGLHEQDALKQSQKDLIKMKQFISEHTTASDPTTDESLLAKF